jgi:hypothetical protein
MTAPPQTHPPISPAQQGSERSRPHDSFPGAEACVGTRDRARQTLPAVDASTVFGCVDWFLYPEGRGVGGSSGVSELPQAIG